MPDDLRVMVQVTGGDELFAALNDLEPAAAKSVVSRAFNPFGKKIMQLAQSLAPEDSGETRGNIKKRKLRTPNGLYAVGIGLSARAFHRGFYPAHVDLGYTAGETSPVEPNPFMEAAFDFYLDRMKVEIPNALWAGVLRRWKKQGIT